MAQAGPLPGTPPKATPICPRPSESGSNWGPIILPTSRTSNRSRWSFRWFPKAGQTRAKAEGRNEKPKSQSRNPKSETCRFGWMLRLADVFRIRASAFFRISARFHLHHRPLDCFRAGERGVVLRAGDEFRTARLGQPRVRPGRGASD